MLLYGPDAGLIHERADTLARTVCPDLRDPFRIADLSGSLFAADPARLADEAAQMSLIGGRRVIRVRDAADRLAGLFAGLLATSPGDALIVVEAGDLPGSSTLRRVFDTSPRAAAIGCYPDTPRDRAGVIRDTMRAHRITASGEAIQYLIEHPNHPLCVALRCSHDGVVCCKCRAVTDREADIIEFDAATLASVQRELFEFRAGQQAIAAKVLYEILDRLSTRGYAVRPHGVADEGGAVARRIGIAADRGRAG